MTYILDACDRFLAGSMPRHQPHIKLLKDILQRLIEKYPTVNSVPVYSELVSDEGDDQEFCLVFLSTRESFGIYINSDTIKIHVGESYSVWDVNGNHLKSTCPLAERYDDLESYLDMQFGQLL